jgi:hypothetical protein
VVKELEQHRIHQAQAREKAGSAWEERGLVFPNNNGRHFNRSSLHTLFKKLVRGAGLRPNSKLTHKLALQRCTQKLTNFSPKIFVEPVSFGMKQLMSTLRE